MSMTFSEYASLCRKAANDAKKTLKPSKELINPELDHIVPIKFGYAHKIPWEVISKPENFEWIDRKSNRSKGDDLTEEGRTLLAEWYEQGIINRPIGQDLTAQQTFDFTPIIDLLENYDDVVSASIPLNVAINIDAIWCQRNETLRWEKTKRALGRVFLGPHRVMQFVVYPDGKIERADGNTRSYIFRNNLQFPDYQVPEKITALFYKVKDKAHAEQIYHSIDSSLTAETFSEKLSGYIRHHGYDEDLPRKWKKGESVYDMAVVVLENYLPPNESEYATLERVSGDGERAAKTAEKLDYFIEEMVMVGNMVGQANIPSKLTAPLLAMMIRFLILSKDDRTVSGFEKFIDFMTNDEYAPFKRVKDKRDPAFKNFMIMLDELQTSEEVGKALNPYINVEASTRRILPDVPTKTTANVQDRRLYCGWVAYCIDKYLNNEVMDEDIIFDVTGVKIDNDTPVAQANKVTTKARSLIMQKYDDFWKDHKSTP